MADTSQSFDVRATLLTHAGGQDAAVAAITAALANATSDGASLRRAAWLAFAASDHALGEALLRRAARCAGDAGESWFALGLVRLGSAEEPLALAAFVAAARAKARHTGVQTGDAARLRQSSPDGNRYAPIGLFYAAFDDAFTCFAVVKAVTQAEHEHYAFCFDRAMAYLGQSPAAEIILSADRERNGDSFWYHVNKGHRLWTGGQRDEADVHYALARKDVLDRHITPFHYNCGIVVWLSRTRAQALLDQDRTNRINSTWKWHLEPVDQKPVGALLVGFDPNYFVFFPKFLMSVVRAYKTSGVAAPFRVHCHIANAPREQVDFVLTAAAAIKSHAPALQVSISVGPALVAEPAHYTCLRYLALPGLMRSLDCGIVAMDVDSEILPSFFKQWPQIAQHDFGLRMYSFNDAGQQVGGEPWSIGAHPTYIADTPLGRRFADFMHDYIEATYDPALVTNWTIDQCAIARGFDLLLRNLPFDRIFNFARGDALYRLPNDYGSKNAFLNVDPVIPANFFSLLNTVFAQPGSGYFTPHARYQGPRTG